MDRADVRRSLVRRRPGEATSERDRDPIVAERQVRLRERADGARLPEPAAGVGGRALVVDRAIPVVEEVVEPPVLPLHVEDEVEKSAPPRAEASVSGLVREIEDRITAREASSTQATPSNPRSA